jgi:hypothetical protein
VSAAARALFASLVLALGLGAWAAAASACDGGPYVYAGIAGTVRVAGVGASITPALSAFDVRAGHVAGWVGVGGPGKGPHGTDEWIQVGFSAFPDWLGNDLYFEVARPGAAPVYSRLRAGVEAGHAVRVYVLEMRGRRDWWRVWVDGSPASAAIHLPSSDRTWQPVVTAESWDAGQSVCNDFGYQFDRIRVALDPGGMWSPIRSTTRIGSSETLLVRRSGGAFVAAGGPVAREMFAVR